MRRSQSGRVRTVAAVATAAAAAGLLSGGACGARTVSGRAVDAARAGEPAARSNPCAVPGYAGALRCATIVVPEDRRHPAGRTVALRVVILPATSTDPVADPVFYFTGGPGQAATDGVAGAASETAGLRARRAVVLIDQRGTGASRPLRCAFGGTERALVGFLTGAFAPESLRACHARLRHEGVDVGRYATVDAVQDAEAVRRALGYDQINLFGVSYGTRVAVEYLRRYPAQTRTATVRGLYAPDARFPLQVARDAQRALDLTLRACETDRHCRAAFPAARDDVAVAFARARVRPARLPLGAAGPGATADSITVTPDVLAGTLLFALYSAESAAGIPLAARAAARGDVAALATPGLLTAHWASQVLASGMYLSVVCAEDVPRITPAAADSAASGTFLGDALVRNLRGACGEWLPGAVAPAVPPLRAAVPTLVLTGEIDPVTPPHWGDALLRGLTHGRHVVLAATGHVPSMPPCAVRLFARFLDAGAVEGLDASCAGRSARPPFVTAQTAHRVVGRMEGRPAAGSAAGSGAAGTWDLFWKTGKGTSQSGYLVIRQTGTALAADVHGRGELKAAGTLTGNEVVLTGRKIAPFEIRAVVSGDTLAGALKVLSVERQFTGVRRKSGGSNHSAPDTNSFMPAETAQSNRGS